MAELRLAGNLIPLFSIPGYGHLQMVYEKDDGTLYEYEVQAPANLTELLGGLRWQYPDKNEH